MCKYFILITTLAYKATKFLILRGPETLSLINIRNSANIPLISKQLKYLHQSNPAFNNSFNIFTEFHRYWSLLHNRIIPYPFEHTAKVLNFSPKIKAILNQLSLVAMRKFHLLVVTILLAVH